MTLKSPSSVRSERSAFEATTPRSMKHMDIPITSLYRMKPDLDLGNEFIGGASARHDPMEMFMSSLRSLASSESWMDDSPSTSDDFDESFRSSSGADDSEADTEALNDSVKDLCLGVTTLLNSKETFTLDEGTSLEGEMRRLRKMGKRIKTLSDIPDDGSMATVEATGLLPGQVDEIASRKEKLNAALKATLPSECKRRQTYEKQKEKLSKILRESLPSSSRSRSQDTSRHSLIDALSFHSDSLGSVADEDRSISPLTVDSSCFGSSVGSFPYGVPHRTPSWRSQDSEGTFTNNDQRSRWSEGNAKEDVRVVPPFPSTAKVQDKSNDFVPRIPRRTNSSEQAAHFFI